MNGASDAISTVSGAALTVNGVSVTMETGGEGLETILDANGKISEEITTNTDGSWLDHLWDTTNQYSWTEEEFSHTANGSLAEETVKNANGTSMVDYFDVYGQDTYSQDIRYYDGDTLKEDLLLNHDGTQMVTWYGDYGYNHTIDETTTYSRWDSGVTFNGRYDQDYVGIFSLRRDN